MGVGDKLLEFTDEVGARFIMKAAAKMKKVNALLEEKGSDVRIVTFEVQPGAPPSMVFCVEPVAQEQE